MNEIAIRTIDDAGRVSKALAESGFYKDAKTAAQAMVKVMAGIELGITPIAAMTGLHIVEGKVTIGSGLVGAQIQRSGKYRYRILEMSEKTCRLQFQELEGDKWIDLNPVSEFSYEDAKRAELTGKSNWKKYLKAMLFSRALTQGARMHTPSIFAGPVYTPEELGVDDPAKTIDVPHEDIKDSPKAEKPITNVEPKQEPKQEAKPASKELPTSSQAEELQNISQSLAFTNEERKALSDKAATADKVLYQKLIDQAKIKIDERRLNGVSAGQIEFVSKQLATNKKYFNPDEMEATLKAFKSTGKTFEDAEKMISALIHEVSKRVTGNKAPVIIEEPIQDAQVIDENPFQ